MNNREIAIKKEALLLHGEWLRLQVRIDIIDSTRPLKLVGNCLNLISLNSRYIFLSKMLARLTPNKGIRSYLNFILPVLSFVLIAFKVRHRH